MHMWFMGMDAPATGTVDAPATGTVDAPATGTVVVRGECGIPDRSTLRSRHFGHFSRIILSSHDSSSANHRICNSVFRQWEMGVWM